jgi:hypothetical protein
MRRALEENYLFDSEIIATHTVRKSELGVFQLGLSEVHSNHSKN